jgi:hypothetical protein
MFSLLALLVVGFSASGCSLIGQATGDPGSFRIYVLKTDLDDVNLGRSYEEAWAVLQTLDLEDHVAVITGQDVEVYDWKEHRLVLSPDGTKRLYEQLNQNAGDRLANFMEDSYSGRIAYVLSGQLFVVELDNKKVYGGALGVGVPARGIACLLLLMDPGKDDRQIVFVLADLFAYGAANVPEVHDFFLSIGKLKE